MLADAPGVPILVLRHGPTPWNEEGRIQGLSDIPLSEIGASLVKRWCLPKETMSWTAYASPLLRTRQTAELLGLRDAEIESSLAEMDWGRWEGESLRNLRAGLGNAMADNEARGLDFRPPNGESPRDVQERIRPFLSKLAQRGDAAILVTHKGVLRALYALAADWDMASKPAVKLRDYHAHRFLLSQKDGRKPEVSSLNIPLLPAGENDD